MNQENIRKEITEIRKKIEKKHGCLKAFRNFKKGTTGLIFKGHICPDEETFVLYKRYALLCLLKH